MTPEEKFIFDLDGYLVVKNVLSCAEVDALNALADEAWPGECDENNMRRTSRVSRWGPASQALLDHPNALPYMVELLGPKVRIDHDYCIFMQKGGKAGRLHGGQTMQGGVPGDHWYKYHDGMIRNGLTVFTYCLTHAGSGDGGFGCIPGSHKSNFTVDIPGEVRSSERPAHYLRQTWCSPKCIGAARASANLPWQVRGDFRESERQAAEDLLAALGRALALGGAKRRAPWIRGNKRFPKNDQLRAISGCLPR